MSADEIINNEQNNEISELSDLIPSSDQSSEGMNYKGINIKEINSYAWKETARLTLLNIARFGIPIMVAKYYHVADKVQELVNNYVQYLLK